MHFLPPFGVKDNAKFSIAFVLKISIMFFSIRERSLNIADGGLEGNAAECPKNW